MWFALCIGFRPKNNCCFSLGLLSQVCFTCDVSASPAVPGYFLFTSSSATLLVLRFAHNVGDGSSTFNQVHDYLASELERSVRVDAGALVVTGIADLLIVAKARLLRTDGLLPLADLISNNLHQLPGLRR